MKLIRTLAIVAFLTVSLSSCNFLRNIFGGGASKTGCPTSVNNVGAEKLMDGYKPKNKEEAKAIKKAKKADMKAAKKNPYMY
ncbi:MAG TPA: hypothetical protein PLW32_14140 [Chitinophagaceae bacterium]|jgi:hypothetical protein|nr:hypothetical protein [Chitinophagaceae bacterium]HPH25025.1 hypothetical protein [Chitinophagaceae bacterium]